MALHKGWDVIITEPGEQESVKCRVCDTEMEVTRNVTGPTSYGSAVMGMSRLHDSFVCKHAKKKWHRQVRKLRQEVEATPSGKLAALYNEEIAEILKSKRCTKETPFDF